MVVTILDAQVESDKWAVLENTYRSTAAPLPPAIVQSFLLQDKDDQDHWRIVTVWESEEALEEYRQLVDTPGGVLIFRTADAEPTFSAFYLKVQVSSEE